MAHCADLFSNFIKAVKETVIDAMDIETADHLLESLEAIITWVIKKKEEGVDVRMVE